MLGTLESKIDRLEAEINRCLQEKQQCDLKLAQLENHHLQVVNAAKGEKSDRAELESEQLKEIIDSDEIRPDVDLEHLTQMVAINADIQARMTSLAETIKQMQTLLRKLAPTDLTESSLFEDNQPSKGKREDEAAKQSEKVEDSGSDSSNDELLSLLAGLLDSPAVMKMLPTLLKQLAK